MTLRTNQVFHQADRFVPPQAGTRKFLDEETFKRMISIERKRTERTRHPFLLMLLEAGHVPNAKNNGYCLDRIVAVMQSSTRDTDVLGWYNAGSTIGVIYTGLADLNKNQLQSITQQRVYATLATRLTSDELTQVSLSFHFFPDDWEQGHGKFTGNPVLYPDLFIPDGGKWSVRALKRSIDVIGSALLLALCAPLFVLIALAVKASSKGPVFFRQQRVGQYGRHFTFLKFRSMQVNSDHSIHKEYVTKFIACAASKQPSNGNGEGVYKLTNDTRVTRVGKFLRRTSLDEVPQFLNVLKGDMSLVGPRPPIPYELAAYQTWHRRRVLEVKPGITGLWQVTGRSRVNFDEMVRLDLRYATSWSPSLDLMILMSTPLAVIKGEGAH